METAFAFRYEVYQQAANSTAPLYAGSMTSAGFQLVDPISFIFSNNTLITGPGYGASASRLSESGLTATVGPGFFSDPTGNFKRSLGDGTFRFQFLVPPVFDGTIELAGQRYPSALRISNLNALQAVAADMALVTWDRIGDATPGDHITVSVSNERGEEVFSTAGVTTAGVEDENATTAQIFLPPGRASFGDLTVTRVTASAETPGAKLIAGYATSTTFPLRSVGAPDTVPPQPQSVVPSLDAVGVSPSLPVEITFDEPMRRRGLLRGISSATANTRQRLDWSADQRRVRITFPDPLPAGPLTLTFDDDNLGQSFQDISSNRIPAGTIAARFFVGNLPVFSSQPACLTPDPGTNVSLTATAIWPLGGLSYQWFRDGIALTGATRAVLDLPNIQLAQAGLYEVRATNANGAAVSAPALVTLDTLNLSPRGAVVPSEEAVYPPNRYDAGEVVHFG